MPEISFTLRPAAPFRLDLTAWVLRRRPHNLMDRWDRGIYRRVLMFEANPVEVDVSQIGPPGNPSLEVRAGGPEVLEGAEKVLAPILTRMLGLQVDLGSFYQMAGQEPRLGELVERFRGVKPPRYPTVFEALVNAVACQQLSLTAGIHVLNRLTAAFGPKLQWREPANAFPRPPDLAEREPEEFRKLGFSYSKARALIAISRQIVDGSLDLESLESKDDEQVSKYLVQLKGVGRWSAEYVLLRGLGRLEVFPGDDVGAQNRLREWLNLSEPLDYEAVRRHLARWQPFAGLVYFHFLLGHLAQEGHIV